MNKSNQYALQSKRKKRLAHAKNAGAKVLHSAGEMARDLVIGGMAGAALGAVLGRYSLLLGAGVSTAGYYYEKPALSALGLGMMASGTYQVVKPMNGTDGVDDQVEGLEGAKERLTAFGKGFSQKLWLDKFIPSLKTSEAVSGLGETQYFVYPNNPETSAVGELDMSAFDRIEAQINKNTQQYAKQQQVSGTDGVDGPLDEERIY